MPKLFKFSTWTVVSPALLYDNFSYKSDTTLGLEDYFRDSLQGFKKSLIIKTSEEKFILEIGSNNGRFISLFKSPELAYGWS